MNERDEQAVKAAVQQEALKQIKASELRAIVKDAYKELIGDYVRMFGWYSLRTLGVLGAGALIVLILWAAGYSKAP